ncbi:hypothetical protein C8A00DRAFT_35342 [Chaetomidium leptoderma]|uniref:Amidoligase enzyme-domain-containing protein n=1 Tax=Chaetomidium leptoderma TaxID=669021 RepID=A0AAN6ZV15_9PEZI|nr:hypothetical protein C8A00DRAFT_35342 [Chaetomidium leptoderma]
MMPGRGYHFGVELEVIAQPRTVRHPLVHSVYYEKLASSLRARGVRADADNLEGGYRKHPEHYNNKWWITKDGSLGNPNHPLIPLEAVSPIFSTTSDWESAISTFWRGFDRVFHMLVPSSLCGSHIHVSPQPAQQFSLSELHALAFGVVHYESHVRNLLPEDRKHNRYCRLNTEHSKALLRVRNLVCRRSRSRHVWMEIEDIDDLGELKEFMQAGDGQMKNRYVLWNFDNIVQPGGSGSVEFRGAKGLRGPVRTNMWIAFVTAFVHLCLNQGFHTWDKDDFADPDMTVFWEGILVAAKAIGVREHLPAWWQVMPELISDDAFEEEAGQDPSFIITADLDPLVPYYGTISIVGSLEGEVVIRF